MQNIQKIGKYGVEDIPNEFVSNGDQPDISINFINEYDMEFEIKNIHTSLANALRRILISEIPTMSIEKVLIENNTSVIPDEILAARLGLIPIFCDPNAFEFHTGLPIDTPSSSSLVFELNIEHDYSKDVNHIPILSDCLKWIPLKSQEYLKDTDMEPRPVLPDILIAKIRPGQVIKLKAICRKGIARDHAKFSPVATASYRMMPNIILKNRVFDDRARRLQKYFSSGVIELKELKNGVEAIVNGTQRDSMSFNVVHDQDLKDDVEIRRIPNHFIFSIESTGIIKPQILFKSAIKILKDKCKKYVNITTSSGS